MKRIAIGFLFGLCVGTILVLWGTEGWRTE